MYNKKHYMYLVQASTGGPGVYLLPIRGNDYISKLTQVADGKTQFLSGCCSEGCSSSLAVSQGLPQFPVIWASPHSNS